MTSERPPKHPWTAAIDEAVDRYHDVLTAYVARGGEDHLALVERMVARGAVFAGRPLCTFLRPNFVLRPQYMQLRRAVEHFRSAIIKAKDIVLREPQLLELLALTDGERRLFSYNPAFESVGVVTRLDAILSGPDISFVELNAEGAFGPSYADRLTEIFEGFQPMREFIRGAPATPIYSGNSLVGAILDAWHEFGGTHVPKVAVVDWQEVATRTEFDMICERFKRHGIPARFVDPRELEFKDGLLSSRGEVIDLVYRRVLTSELLGREDEVKALIEAYKARVVCVVNSFRAKLLDKKVLFALLFDPRVTSSFTPEEEASVRQCIPWTRRVEETKTEGPDGQTIDLLPWARDNRTRLVLKPNDELGGRGVLIGASVEGAVWERALKLGLVDPSVLQLRVPLPTSMFPEVGAAGELYFSRRYMELDPILFRGELGGLLGRLSATNMCNVHTGAGTVPTFIIEQSSNAA
ncbi:MAG: hypothetical protein IPM54_27635 [Polyangiaceae bacterium]|nr:hypothetical protein [Polyangiaceae bacterium]